MNSGADTALRLLESQILTCAEYSAVCSALPPAQMGGPVADTTSVAASSLASSVPSQSPVPTLPIPSAASPTLRSVAQPGSPSLTRKRRRAMHDPKKLTVCLDLDETLIHSVVADGNALQKPEVESFWLTVGEHELIVLKRPGLEDFLNRAADLFNLYVFTAGTAAYVQCGEGKLSRVQQRSVFRASPHLPPPLVSPSLSLSLSLSSHNQQVRDARLESARHRRQLVLRPTLPAALHHVRRRAVREEPRVCVSA